MLRYNSGKKIRGQAVKQLSFSSFGQSEKKQRVFRVLKCQFEYRKTRYHGLAKNRAQFVTLMALSKLYFARKRLRAESV